MTKQPATKPKKKPGPRRSEFDQKVADRICSHIIEGKSLRRICGFKAMPSKPIVLRWLATEPAFAAQYAQAREEQAEGYADELMDLGRQANAENAHAIPVRADIIKWVCSKLKPKKFGDRVGLDVSGELNHTVETDPRNAWLHKQRLEMSLEERTESGRRVAWELVCMGKLLTDAGFPAAFEEVAFEFARKVNRYFLHGDESEVQPIPRLAAPIEINPLPAAGEQPAPKPDESPEAEEARRQAQADLREELRQQQIIELECQKQAQPGQVVRGPFRGWRR